MGWWFFNDYFVVVVVVFVLLEGKDKSFVACKPLFDDGYRFAKELINALMEYALVSCWYRVLKSV